MTFVKAVKCDECGKIDNKASSEFRAVTAPFGPCENCGSEQFYIAVVKEV